MDKNAFDSSLNNLLSGLLNQQSKDYQQQPIYKLLAENPEFIESPNSLSLNVLSKNNGAIKQAIMDMKKCDRKYADIFFNYDFFKSHVEKLCVILDGYTCSADKSKALLNRYLNYLLTGEKGRWEAGELVYIEKIKKEIKCYWLPSTGTQDQWYDFIDSLWFLYYGSPSKYFNCYNNLIKTKNI